MQFFKIVDSVNWFDNVKTIRDDVEIHWVKLKPGFKNEIAVLLSLLPGDIDIRRILHLEVFNTTSGDGGDTSTFVEEDDDLKGDDVGDDSVLAESQHVYLIETATTTTGFGLNILTVGKDIHIGHIPVIKRSDDKNQYVLTDVKWLADPNIDVIALPQDRPFDIHVINYRALIESCYHYYNMQVIKTSTATNNITTAIY